MLAPQERQKSSQKQEGLGRSRGGFSSKIHTVTEAKGRPLRLEVTPGQVSDIGQAKTLLSGIDIEAVAADKAYDGDALVETLLAKGIEVVIPPRSNRKQPRKYNTHLYKQRNWIERFFGKIKHYRRVFSRFEKTRRNYLAMLHFASALIWLR
jgi:transposase